MKKLKNLQASAEEKWVFTSYASFEGVVRRPEKAEEVILLLHGLGERGKRIFRKLLSCLPETALVIAPNAPFPIPRPQEGRTDYGHSWYFYDKTERKYFITQDLAKFWLRDMLKMENPHKLPVTLIGFSQGGYLAPLAGKEIAETKLVIGISCEFRTSLIHEKLPFPLAAIHGDADQVVPLASSKQESENLKPRGISVDYRTVPGAGHEITPDMGRLVKELLETYGKRSL